MIHRCSFLEIEILYNWNISFQIAAIRKTSKFEEEIRNEQEERKREEEERRKRQQVRLSYVRLRWVRLGYIRIE